MESQLGCIRSPVCLPCIVNHRVNEILKKTAEENRYPTDQEHDEMNILHEAMMEDIRERSMRRQNVIVAVNFGIIDTCALGF